MAVQKFIEEWREVGGTERANYVLFITGLCQILDVPPPSRSVGDDDRDNYVFERHVRKLDLDGAGAANFIDCYKRGCFVLEAKQSNKRVTATTGSLFPESPFMKAPVDKPVWDRLMKSARAQALRYAQNLPSDHDWPPFLIVMDVGHVIELYADFTGMGRGYQPFPDERSHRIGLEALADPAIRDRLRAVWTEPRSLDPAIKRTEVTRDVAARLAKVAQTLEKKHDAKVVAEFLMRCLFTGFAEDVRLLPKDCFLHILEKAKKFPQHLPDYLNPLWQAMENGRGFLKEIEAPVRYFNGGLFKNAHALPLTEDELNELIVAVRKDWRNVEPAIFGTLLEKALTDAERARYGAEFTPRAYVERLVVPTVVEPLEEEWEAVQGAAEQARVKGDRAGAVKEIKAFHRKLCETKVLDPACGTGNFLYVTLERLKRLETRVLQTLDELGINRQQDLDIAGHTVGPAQFLGLEKNGRAVHIAELVLWIGHLQLQLRHTPVEALGEPILQPIRSVREADAVLVTGKERIVLENGKPKTRWDGVTTRKDPLTGREVPDETKRIEIMEYPAAREAEWPQADFIIGNPPFIAGKDLRQELGDGYAEALWNVYKDIPGGADFVMYWWHKAASLVRDRKARRFGFITTNTITQTFCRRVIQRHQLGKPPLHLAFAIADHPWSDGSGMAAVRIAMTVGTIDPRPGVLKTVIAERGRAEGGGVEVELEAVESRIGADLTVGPDVAGAVELKANDKLACPGVKLHGSGFIVSPAEARNMGLGTVPGLETHIRPYLNGRDFTGRSRGKMVIDLYGLTEVEVRQRFPAVYQLLFDRVREERQAKAHSPDGRQYAETWWLFGKTRGEFRRALLGLPRYISTVETAKHRVFQFLDASILPDNRLINIAIAEGWALGVLSSRIHLVWALSAGGLLEDRPIYTKSTCFDTFPFPVLTDAQTHEIGALAEELDAHRKRVLADHPNDLTLTDLYNVLEKRKLRTMLTPGEQVIDRLGSVAVIQALHDRIDSAVAAAYGWPADLSDTAILERLVALNAERRREEVEEGLIRWLRPDYQDPEGRKRTGQIAATLLDGEEQVSASWPKAAKDQILAVQTLLRRTGTPMSVTEVARSFKRAREAAVRDALSCLAALGSIRALGDDRYAA